MAAADVHARRAGRNQRERDAHILLGPDQPLRIVQAESKTQQRGDRPQRDVALLPREPDAEDAGLPLPLAPADYAVIRNAARVRPGLRAGERETRNVLTAREARQVMVLLRLRAVIEQQFGRAERIRNHHRHRRRRTARGELHDDFGMRDGRKAQAAIRLGNDESEIAVAPDVVPGRCGKIVQLVRDAPLVEHFAQRLDRAVEKRLLLGRQAAGGQPQEPVPVRPAAEKLAVPPHRTRVEGGALARGNAGQPLPETLQQRAADETPPQHARMEQQRAGGKNGPGHARRRRKACDQRSEREPCPDRRDPRFRGAAAVSEEARESQTAGE